MTLASVTLEPIYPCFTTDVDRKRLKQVILELQIYITYLFCLLSEDLKGNCLNSVMTDRKIRNEIFLFTIFLLACTIVFVSSEVSTDQCDNEKDSSGIGEVADKIIDLLSDTCCCKCSSVSHPGDCSDLKKTTRSGIYKIYPEKLSGFDVYCDMDQDGVGWTVIQRRMNGKIDFYRDWQSYKKGFGDLKEEFWLGNDHIHQLTKQGTYMLRIEMEDFENNKRYAEYKTFSVGSESSGYKLELGKYSGDAGDSFSYQNGMKFTTKDKDNDKWSRNCATTYKGAWWYNACHHSNINGLYLKGKHKSFADGVIWYHFKGHHYSLKKTVMMIRRI